MSHLELISNIFIVMVLMLLLQNCSTYTKRFSSKVIVACGQSCMVIDAGPSHVTLLTFIHELMLLLTNISVLITICLITLITVFVTFRKGTVILFINH